MIYLKWLLMIPVSLAVTLLTFPLAFVLPFFATDGWLPKWLFWFQTPDNSLNGDNGWKNEHWQWRFKLPKLLAIYIGQIGWLWRNPGYGYGLVKLENATATYSGNKLVNDCPGVAGWCFVKSAGLFQFVWVFKISSAKCIYCNFGWNVKGLIDSKEEIHLATFAFSPRISHWC